MANNYCETSAFLNVPADKLEQAAQIVDREVESFDEDEDWGYCGVEAEMEGDGVWFHSDGVIIDHLEQIAKALVEELEIDEPFYASWSYTCDKPRIDEFGGGALCVRRGKDTIWFDAMNHVHNIVEKEAE